MSVKEKWDREMIARRKSSCVITDIAQETTRTGVKTADYACVSTALLAGLLHSFDDLMQLTLDCHQERMERNG